MTKKTISRVILIFMALILIIIALSITVLAIIARNWITLVFLYGIPGSLVFIYLYMKLKDLSGWFDE